MAQYYTKLKYMMTTILYNNTESKPNPILWIIYILKKHGMTWSHAQAEFSKKQGMIQGPNRHSWP